MPKVRCDAPPRRRGALDARSWPRERRSSFAILIAFTLQLQILTDTGWNGWQHDSMKR